MSFRGDLKHAFNILSENARDIFLGSEISETFKLPTPLEFSRDFVGKNLPTIIRNGVSNWTACTKWSPDYLRSKFADKCIQVSVTPNGKADAIYNKIPENISYFVLPEEQMMSMSQFIEKLDYKDDKQVLYLQTQNSNLSKDFPELCDDYDLDTLYFATEAFNKQPDAINLWIGEDRAITSLHKDPYENIYCVISGYKDFILIPPTDYAFVPRSKYPKAIYKTGETGELDIQPILDENNKPVEIEWVSVDLLNPNLTDFPEFEKASQYHFRLYAGDMLYLPSLWYHHVRQSHKCIAINFWYDMEYDARYCYYKMVESLCGHGEL